ncbi:lycopene beta-cyclase CrtY [Pseudomonas japonica]|uniref:lycopene beta-cyclase CrtY n=1 Tax=Pseudomonas japonica TaxID=256466 RepID=UPI0015E46E1E|nr:lycopene beta-cyclase CrtY [Pseudomonas japonica]MBA1289478.1 lycopene beta-cyclase CrtY [Pseudomonas japonica]
MKRTWDLILVGAGLANGLIAWRLQMARPELSVLVIEQAAALGEAHTWSFHESDLSVDQLRWAGPLVSHRWPGYQVRFPNLKRTFSGAYCSISGEHFGRTITAALGRDLMLGATVQRLTPDTVQLGSGETLHAGAVIDGRGLEASGHLRLGYQRFLGQEVRLATSHGLALPTVMDASVAQHDGYRFVYVLPLADDRLLIEDTYYTEDGQLEPVRLRDRVNAYAQAQGWTITEVIREEQGSLPIVLAGRFEAFYAQGNGVARSGLRAGLFHPVTGYSLPEAVRLADLIAATPTADSDALQAVLYRYRRALWRRQRFFRLLNRMLFLAGTPDNRWRVLERFHRLAPGLIQRFYAGTPTLADKARLLMGKPPVPVGPAVKAMLDYAPPVQEEP